MDVGMLMTFCNLVTMLAVMCLNVSVDADLVRPVCKWKILDMRGHCVYKRNVLVVFGKFGCGDVVFLDGLDCPGDNEMQVICDSWFACSMSDCLTWPEKTLCFPDDSLTCCSVVQWLQHIVCVHTWVKPCQLWWLCFCFHHITRFETAVSPMYWRHKVFKFHENSTLCKQVIGINGIIMLSCAHKTCCKNEKEHF